MSSGICPTCHASAVSDCLGDYYCVNIDCNWSSKPTKSPVSGMSFPCIRCGEHTSKSHSQTEWVCVGCIIPGPPEPPEPPPADLCHCGEPATADCPCCEGRICAVHIAKAAWALAGAIGLKKTKETKDA